MPAGLPGLAIAAATIFLIILRPRGLPEGVSALLGGIASVVVGAVSPAQAGLVALGTLNILGFFLGMMAITALAEQAGFFAWAAGAAARLAGGSPRRLFLAVFLTGAVITIFFSNDATALALTPLVLLLTDRTGLPPLPYVFACAFVANVASTALPVSNPLNIIVLSSFPRSLGAFARFLGLPTALALAACYLLLRWLFRADLAGRFDPAALKAEPAECNAARFRFTAAALGAIALAYLAAAALMLPLAAVALAGAGLLAAGHLALRSLDARRLGRQISWSIFPFVTGMFVVVQALENGGWTARVAQAVLAMPRLSPLLGSLGSVFLVGAAANAVNNLPIAVVMISTLRQAAGPPPVLLYGTILGADLGPCLSVTGSLAGMLWLIMLRRRGLNISGWRYLRAGAVVTPALLAVAAAGLWLTLRLAG